MLASKIKIASTRFLIDGVEVSLCIQLISLSRSLGDQRGGASRCNGGPSKRKMGNLSTARSKIQFSPTSPLSTNHQDESAEYTSSPSFLFLLCHCHASARQHRMISWPQMVSLTDDHRISGGHGSCGVDLQVPLGRGAWHLEFWSLINA